MKAGLVARIRVNPKDCQSVLDVLDRVGIQRHNLSFSACVSLALSSLLETARMQKLIPEPDPFQYLNRLGEYAGQGHIKHKVRGQAALAIGSLGEKFTPPNLASGSEPARQDGGAMNSPAAPLAPLDNGAELEYAKNRLAELVSKKDMTENGFGEWYSTCNISGYTKL